MAVSILSSDLNSFKTQELRKILTFTPAIEPWMKKQNPQWSKKGGDGGSVTSMKKDDEYTYLPMLFGMKYLQKGNDFNNHANVQMTFTGQLRDLQKPYVNQAIKQLNDDRVTTLNLRPGFGKTTMSAAISSKTGLLTVVLIKNKTLYPQWAKTYKERTTASVWCVGEGRPPQTVDVIICLWTRVDQIPKELRDMVGFLIVDEAHRFNNIGGVNAMLSFQPKYMITCTATFEKRNGMHAVMESFVGREKVATDQIVPFTITKYETGIFVQKVKRGDTTDWHKLNKGLLYNPERNMIAMEIIEKLIKLDRKVLVFTTEVEHVKQLHSMLKGRGIESCDWLSGDKSSYKDSTILVSNPQKSGEGFDEEMFCEDFGGRRIDTILLLGSFKDLALLYQVCGRAFRADNPWIIDFVDEVDTIKRQYGEREWWYTRNGGTLKAERHPRRTQENIAHPLASPSSIINIM